MNRALNGVAQVGKELIGGQTETRDFLDILHSQPCEATAATLSLVGNKWTVLIIMLLADQPRRFNELKRLIGGVSQRMLTLTLRELEREGLVARTAFPTIPPRVDYALTELGQSLKGAASALVFWAIENQPALHVARSRYDAPSEPKL